MKEDFADIRDMFTWLVLGGTIQDKEDHYKFTLETLLRDRAVEPEDYVLYKKSIDD
jgi:hypothetical protein